MKIIFAIELNDEKEEVSKQTISSLKGKKYLTVTKENFLSETKKILPTAFDSVVLIPNNSILNENYIEICSVYQTEDSILLPLVILNSEKINGVLNTCLWNTNLTGTIGQLDHELAVKQIDLTLYGAIIPLKYLIEENFNKEIKYYGDFYFLNKVTKNDINVIGAPKTLLTTEIDLTFSSIPNDERIKYFNMAKEV